MRGASWGGSGTWSGNLLIPPRACLSRGTPRAHIGHVVEIISLGWPETSCWAQCLGFTGPEPRTGSVVARERRRCALMYSSWKSRLWTSGWLFGMTGLLGRCGESDFSELLGFFIVTATSSVSVHLRSALWFKGAEVVSQTLDAVNYRQKRAAHTGNRGRKDVKSRRAKTN